MFSNKNSSARSYQRSVHANVLYKAVAKSRCVVKSARAGHAYSDTSLEYSSFRLCCPGSSFENREKGLISYEIMK